MLSRKFKCEFRFKHLILSSACLEVLFAKLRAVKASKISLVKVNIIQIIQKIQLCTLQQQGSKLPLNKKIRLLFPRILLRDTRHYQNQSCKQADKYDQEPKK